MHCACRTVESRKTTGTPSFSSCAAWLTSCSGVRPRETFGLLLTFSRYALLRVSVFRAHILYFLFRYIKQGQIMARITVDDCLKRIPNRFDMTLVATLRARQLSVGGTPMVEPARDKPTVIALREVSQGKIGMDILTAGPL